MARMRTPFIGSEAMASGRLTRHELRSRFVAVYPGVYVDADGRRDRKVALDYEGEHHRNPVRFNTDIRRHHEVADLRWTDIRVTSLDTEAVIIARLTAAWARRASRPAALSG